MTVKTERKKKLRADRGRCKWNLNGKYSIVVKDQVPEKVVISKIQIFSSHASGKTKIPSIENTVQ